jgi:hypothetical protein
MHERRRDKRKPLPWGSLIVATDRRTGDIQRPQPNPGTRDDGLVRKSRKSLRTSLDWGFLGSPTNQDLNRRAVNMNQAFPYFGSKKRIARHYPAPLGDVVIEPFAGAAGYSMHYEPKKAILFDVYDAVVRAWRFLIDAGNRGGDPIMDLPIIDPGCDVPDIEGKELIGFWCVRGVESPRYKLPDSGWVRQYPDRFWGVKQRARLAAECVKVKDWEVHCGNFSDAAGIVGTWFVDPPYEQAGKHYARPFHEYNKLAEFCREQRDLVIVCEESTDSYFPSWLDFEPFLVHSTMQKRKATEVIWTSQSRWQLF